MASPTVERWKCIRCGRPRRVGRRKGDRHRARRTVIARSGGGCEPWSGMRARIGGAIITTASLLFPLGNECDSLRVGLHLAFVVLLEADAAAGELVRCFAQPVTSAHAACTGRDTALRLSRGSRVDVAAECPYVDPKRARLKQGAVQRRSFAFLCLFVQASSRCTASAARWLVCLTLSVVV